MKKLFSTRYSDTAFSFAILILRLGLGTMVAFHGYTKLMKFSSLSQTFSDPFHIGHTASLSLVIFAEFFCGALVVLGLLTRFACIPLVIAMFVALYFSHHMQIFAEGEKAALYLTGFITLLFVGPGKVSVDRLIGK